MGRILPRLNRHWAVPGSQGCRMVGGSACGPRCEGTRPAVFGPAVSKAEPIPSVARHRREIVGEVRLKLKIDGFVDVLEPKGDVAGQWQGPIQVLFGQEGFAVDGAGEKSPMRHGGDLNR